MNNNDPEDNRVQQFSSRRKARRFIRKLKKTLNVFLGYSIVKTYIVQEGEKQWEQ